MPADSCRSAGFHRHWHGSTYMEVTLPTFSHLASHRCPSQPCPCRLVPQEPAASPPPPPPQSLTPTSTGAAAITTSTTSITATTPVLGSKLAHHPCVRVRSGAPSARPQAPASAPAAPGAIAAGREGGTGVAGMATLSCHPCCGAQPASVLGRRCVGMLQS
jgi:hypothetical protein